MAGTNYFKKKAKQNTLGFVADQKHLPLLKMFQKSVQQWRLVFVTLALISLLGNAIYVALGSAEVQSWNSPQKLEEKKPEDNKAFEVQQ